MHGVSLQGTNDSIELQVFADGVSNLFFYSPFTVLTFDLSVAFLPPG